MARAPFYPIVYIRGYAGTQSEVEDTVADPYMGFNAGSTKLRQLWTGDIDRHIFESPLIRLMKDYEYTDMYDSGIEVNEEDEVSWKSVWIYRYYEPVSKHLGTGKRPEMEDYAEGLGNFLIRMREIICKNDRQAASEFKVHLVAHSMGGLVARCWLQNEQFHAPGYERVPVEKVFTYATPHNGIDLRFGMNVPDFGINNSVHFNRDCMRDYLSISPTEPVNSLDGKFDPQRFFSLIGTNARDYAVLRGASSLAVGPLSDGLVQIKNAYVKDTPRAFVHRAHSGHFGIVNSEEGYQNLCRFLFGDIRLDGDLHISGLSLPAKIQRALNSGKAKGVRASYHIETIVRVRSSRWDLHRRTAGEHSALHAKYDEVVKAGKPLRLFSSFLSKDKIVGRARNMGFSIEIGVLVPEYVVDNKYFFDGHYEGSYIFRDKLNLAIGKDKQGRARVRYGWDSAGANNTNRTIDFNDVFNHRAEDPDQWQFNIPVVNNKTPGMQATLSIMATPGQMQGPEDSAIRPNEPLPGGDQQAPLIY